MGEKKIATLFSLIFLAIMAFMVQVSPYMVKGNDFYKDETKEVLEAYPELKGTEILLKEKSITHTMRARPQIIPLLRGERKYKIIINNDSGKYNGIPVKKLTIEQRKGVIAHELSHIEDYEDKNSLELLIFGIKYLFPSYKESIEKKTDRETIERGFGDELLAFSEFAFNNGSVSDSYLETKKEYYYNPDQLKEIIENNG